MSEFALEFIPGVPNAEERPKIKPKTNVVQQGMSGVNTGLAQALGLPVDGVTGAINLATQGANNAFGTDIGAIENPIGGSESFKALMGSAISDIEPQTAMQRYFRRAGEEVGFGVPLAIATAGTGTTLGAAARTNLPAFLATNTAADVGSGIAGQTAREVAPDSATADIIASLLGGTVTASTVNRMATRKPEVQSRADLQRKTDELYGRVEGSGADLTPQAQDRLSQNLADRFAAEGGDALAYPKANAQLNVIEKNPRQSVYGVEQARRRVSKKVARSPDESDMGQDLIAEIDDYLKSIAPGDVVSNQIDPQEVVADLTEARRLAHQGIKADEVTDALRAADNRASTTGTGGNSLNTQSQEIRKIYDREASIRGSHKSGGYTPDEVAAMEKIVHPSKTERTLQRIGRWSPGTGALQSQAGVGMGGGGLTAAVTTGNPIYALGAAVPAAGVVAQTGAEMLKKKRIDELVKTLLNEGVAAKPRVNQATRAAIVSQLLNSPQ